MVGPGKVVFQDGKVVFVRHGSVFCKSVTKQTVQNKQC